MEISTEMMGVTPLLKQAQVTRATKSRLTILSSKLPRKLSLPKVLIFEALCNDYHISRGHI